MKSFVAVAQAGSFSRAAHALQLGAASVSDHISNLERHVNVSLVNRTTRSVRLTEEGHVYLAMCQEVLLRIDEVERQLARSGEPFGLSGLLRVEMSDGVDAFLQGAVSDFQAEHPDVRVQILRSNHQFDRTLSGADVIIRSALPAGLEAGRFITRTLGRTRTIFLAAPDYIQRKGIPQSPRELMAHRCIGYVDPLSGRLWEWYFQQGEETFSLDVPCQIAMSQGDLRRRAAINGEGIINDLAHFTTSLVCEKSLVPLLNQWTMPQPICHLIYSRDAYRSPRVSAFVKHIESWFARIETMSVQDNQL